MKYIFIFLILVNIENREFEFLNECSLDINIFNSTLNKRFFRLPDCKHYYQSKLASFRVFN
jgi:hypothetical protein